MALASSVSESFVDHGLIDVVEMSALYDVVVDHGADLLDVVGLRRCSGKPAPVNDLADGLIRCGSKP